MSKYLPYSEYIELRRRLTEGYVPVSPRAVEGWIADWNKGLERLHYARVGTFTIAEGLKALVKLRGVIAVRPTLYEMARPDLTVIWEEYVATGLRAYHTIDNQMGGYEFHFAALNSSDQYITGSLCVVKMDKQ